VKSSILKSAVSRLNLSGRALPVLTVGLALTVVCAGQALAQAASPAGGIGAQLNLMSSEGINAGGNLATFGCYAAALICFIFGVWKIWQSRQPQNREQGHLLAGLAGVVLCGLFVGAPSWVNKAAITTSGAAAGVNDAPGMIQFGGGNGG
jgi:uncharacterized membrane protein